MRPKREQPLSQYMKKGYSRVYRDGKKEDMEKSGEHADGETQIVTARTVIGERSKPRITEALEAAFSESSQAFVHIVSGQSLRFSKELRCDLCDIAFEKTTPKHVLFQQPLRRLRAMQRIRKKPGNRPRNSSFRIPV